MNCKKNEVAKKLNNQKRFYHMGNMRKTCLKMSHVGRRKFQNSHEYSFVYASRFLLEVRLYYLQNQSKPS